MVLVMRLPASALPMALAACFTQGQILTFKTGEFPSSDRPLTTVTAAGIVVACAFAAPYERNLTQDVPWAFAHQENEFSFQHWDTARRGEGCS